MWQLYLNLLLGTAVVADVLFRIFVLFCFLVYLANSFHEEMFMKAQTFFLMQINFHLYRTFQLSPTLTKHLLRAQSSTPVYGGFCMRLRPFHHLATLNALAAG